MKKFNKPLCDLVELPFSMQIFQHLEVMFILFKNKLIVNHMFIICLKKSIQSKMSVTMPQEHELLSNLRLESEDFYGHLVNKSLTTVRN